MPRKLMLLLPALLAAAPCFAQSSPAALATAMEAAYNAVDTAALARLYADDPDVTTVGDGRRVRGAAAVRQEVSSGLEQVKGSRMTIDSVVTDPLDGTHALLSANWHLRTPPPDPRTHHGVVTMALVRAGANQPWRILQDHWSLVPVGPVAMPASATYALPDSGPTLQTRALTDCRVTKVVDGDTIECSRLGRVRLIGIDAPERGQVPFGTQSTQALSQMLQRARRVELETDAELHDKYDRILAYVWIDGRMANWLMARSGWAVQLTYPPNVKYVERFQEAVAQARKDGRGLWASGGFACEPKAHRDGKC